MKKLVNVLIFVALGSMIADVVLGHRTGRRRGLKRIEVLALPDVDFAEAYLVIDAASSTDCSVGGGTFSHICFYDTDSGTWVAAGGTAGTPTAMRIEDADMDTFVDTDEAGGDSDIVTIEAANGTNVTGDLAMDNASGPIMVDEASTDTNPTLVPNKMSEGTGVAGADNGTELYFVLGGAQSARIVDGDRVEIFETDLRFNNSSVTTCIQQDTSNDLFFVDTACDGTQDMEDRDLNADAGKTRVGFLTIPDSGDGNPAVGTVENNFTNAIVCSDTDGCTLSLLETGPPSEDIIRLFVHENSVGDVTMTTIADQQNLVSDWVGTPNDFITFVYSVSPGEWVEQGRSRQATPNNTGAMPTCNATYKNTFEADDDGTWAMCACDGSSWVVVAGSGDCV